MRISDWSSDVCSSDLEAQMTAAHHLSVRSGPAAERQPAIFGPLVVEEDDPGAAVAAGMGAFLAVHDDARRTTAVRHDHTDRAVVLADIDALDVAFVEYRLGRGRIGASFGHDGKGESGGQDAGIQRSDEHTSELQSLMRTSYAVF